MVLLIEFAPIEIHVRYIIIHPILPRFLDKLESLKEVKREWVVWLSLLIVHFSLHHANQVINNAQLQVLRWLFNDILSLDIILCHILVDPYLANSCIIDSNGVNIGMEQSKLLVKQRKDCDDLFENEKGLLLADRGQFYEPSEMLGEYFIVLD